MIIEEENADNLYTKQTNAQHLNIQTTQDAETNKILTQREKVTSELTKIQKEKYGANMAQCLKIFNDSIAHGPIYVCTCCIQTWFKCSVHNIKDVRFSHTHEREIFETCRVGWKSVNNNEWTCNTCRNAIRKAIIPKLLVCNKLGFPTQPPELKLYPLEEQLIAPRILFMEFRELQCGGQQLVHGNIVNVPVDIAPTINT